MKKFALALATAAIALVGTTAAHATVQGGTFARNASALTIAKVPGKISLSSNASVGFFSVTTSFAAAATGDFEIGTSLVSAGSIIGSGTAMKSGSETLDSTFASLFSGSSVNDTALGKNLLLPFEFTKAGQTDYGWLSFDVTKSILNTYSYKLDGYAYSNDGTAIEAGTLTAVPEPTSFVLMMAGALGLVAWRRRQSLQG